MCSLFKEKVSLLVLFELLDKISLKTETYYMIDHNSFKQLVFNDLFFPFVKKIKPCYYISKRYFLTRELTFCSFMNIIKQICKSHEIKYDVRIKSGQSVYNVYYKNAEINLTKKIPIEQNEEDIV